jgi:transcriptional regulator with XRE-family HTH domain
MTKTDIEIAYSVAMGTNQWSITSAQRASFAEALRDTMTQRGVNQKELGNKLGVSQTVISQYCRAEFSASPRAIFAIEEVLLVPPGWLSRHLGYYPPEAIPAKDVETAVSLDPDFSDGDRKAVLAMIGTIREYAAARAQMEGAAAKPTKVAAKRRLKVATDGS